MTMTPDVTEKKWQRHDDLAVNVNNPAPWKRLKQKGVVKNGFWFEI